MSDKENSEVQEFSYFLSHNGSILVASLFGLCGESSQETLNKCKHEIEERMDDSIQGVVLNFSGVTGIANELVPFWAQLQSKIRSHHAELRVCGIEAKLKIKLHKLGILRATELSLTLKEALPDIVIAMKKNAALRAITDPTKKAA